jgi:hypothetical protein
MDRGYDAADVYTTVEGKDMRPVIPLRMTPAVKAGKDAPPSCEHGEWALAVSDANRSAAKWRCPTGECNPASVWVKASRLHTLIPRGTDRWKGLCHQRGAMEREFGTLKHGWAMLPLHVRRLPRVQLHVDLTILATLASAALALPGVRRFSWTRVLWVEVCCGQDVAGLGKAAHGWERQGEPGKLGRHGQTVDRPVSFRQSFRQAPSRSAMSLGGLRRSLTGTAAAIGS